eukprot:COSAG06_NODE_26756_length_607_cov_211.169291_1_plen_82_part_01
MAALLFALLLGRATVGQSDEVLPSPQYCDGAGGLRTWRSYRGDYPTCRDICDRCSAAQVVGAMAAAPDDSGVQSNGCYALAR